ncbi:E3 ubiquitin-protein ligase [Thecamonas trahens ATCC 50062]|uniref:E3 ubiquitin-protein ligase n=1 Tax=Thecamonas trahens ATCC 50062 TaxID=461836 RepID=A0A0L0DMQ0_THETB|nr:E3 ubiquitin-protein ligase [Thecamonas trahens ATCC 50062]KNC53316.1 E3 ubiquitin-protein ligase [Thecamonas trahens ATCC 50062]|eukprot:XP_013754576.1 E3 ubiquitin-protein ligase [Thecamonas trahens ATCC 50062]
MALAHEGWVVAAGDDMFAQLTPFTKAAGESGSAQGKEWAALALGETHGVGITADGSVYQWGDDMTHGITRMVALETLVVAKVSLGSEHYIAVTADGGLVAWGRNDVGQLGLGKATPGAVSKPKRVRLPRVIDAIAAANFTLALTDEGTVFAAGDNTDGQLGIGSTNNAPAFASVALPVGIAIVGIAAGASHVLLRDFDGSVWAAGANRHGQLGLGTSALGRAAKFPSRVKGVSDIVAVAAAGDSSAVLDASGRVFTWGAGARGVLGQGSLADAPAPVAIAAFTASMSSIALGPSALFAMEAESGVVWACGSTSHGQLLLDEAVVDDGTLVPMETCKDDTGGNDTTPPSAAAEDAAKFILTPRPIPESPSWRVHGMALAADVTLVACRGDGGADANEQPSLTFPVLTRVNFQALSWAALSELSSETPTPEYERKFLEELRGAFASPPTLNMSFVAREEGSCRHELDLDLATTFFEHINTAPVASRVPMSLLAHVLRLCRSLRSLVSDSPAYSLRFLHLVGLAIDERAVLESPASYLDAIGQFCKVVAGLPPKLLDSYVETLVLYPQRAFQRLVRIVIASFDGILSPYTQRQAPARPIKAVLPRAVHEVLAMIAVLWQANGLRSQEAESALAALPSSAFEAASLRPSPDALSLLANHTVAYTGAKRSATRLGATSFNVCKTPYIVPLASKTALLRSEFKNRQNTAVQQAALASLSMGSPVIEPPALHLPIRRDFMSLDMINLLKEMGDEIDADPGLPLRIQFTEEEGIDDGGLTRELFTTVAHELFADTAGLFVVNAAGYVTIDPCPTRELDDYRAVGRFVGLALYAGAQLGVHFPPHMMRMLLAELRGEPSPAHEFGLRELSELDAQLAHGLQCLLDYAGDVESTFCANFTLRLESPSGTREVELLPGGADIAVTALNRDTYVSKYVEMVLAGAVAEPFAAFVAGFGATSKFGSSTLLHAPTRWTWRRYAATHGTLVGTRRRLAPSLGSGTTPWL